jgi:DNA-binding protein HU-beta
MLKTKTPRPMTKAQLIAALAEQCEMPRKDVQAVLEALIETAYREARKEGGFSFPGLGKLRVVRTAPRLQRVPHLEEPLKLPAGRRVRFRLSQAAKDAVLRGH